MEVIKYGRGVGCSLSNISGLGQKLQSGREWLISWEWKPEPYDEEIRRLRRELAGMKKENEILKKAAAYFAKNQK